MKFNWKSFLIAVVFSFGLGAALAWAAQTNYLGTVFIADTTTPTQQLTVNADGSINATVISGGGVPSIAGTANQITETGSPGATTLSIPSDFRPPGTVNVAGSPAATLTTNQSQAVGGSTLLPFAATTGAATGQIVVGTSVPLGAKVASIVSNAQVSLTANGISAINQKVLTTTATTGAVAGQQCTDVTTPTAIGAGNVIASVQIGVSITMTSNLTAATANADTITCNPVVTLSVSTTAAISSGASIKFLSNATSPSSASAFFDQGDATINGNLNVGGSYNAISATSIASSGAITATGTNGSQFKINTGSIEWDIETSSSSLFIADITNSKFPFSIGPNTSNSLTIGTSTVAVVGPSTFSSTVGLLDTSAAHYVQLTAASSAALTGDRALTFNMQNVAHILTLGTTASTGSGIIFPNTATDTVATLGIANSFSAINSFTNTTDASSDITGSVIIGGGLGVGKSFFLGALGFRIVESNSVDYVGPIGNAALYFQANNIQSVSLYTTGGVGIGAGNADPGAFNLSVAGTVAAGLTNAATTSAVCFNTSTHLFTYDGTIGTCTTSDERLKNMGERIPHALSKLLQINGVYGTWKDKAMGAGRQIFVGAQTVERVFPELVQTDSTGTKSLDYQRLAAPIIESLRELDARLSKVEARRR